MTSVDKLLHPWYRPGMAGMAGMVHLLTTTQKISLNGKALCILIVALDGFPLSENERQWLSLYTSYIQLLLIKTIYTPIYDKQCVCFCWRLFGFHNFARKNNNQTFRGNR